MTMPESPPAPIADEPPSTPLLDGLLLVTAHLRLLLLGPVCIAAAAFAVSFLFKPTYTAKAVILPPQQQQSAAAAALQSLGSLAGVAGSVAGLRTPADQFVALMTSMTVTDRLIDRHRLMEVYDEEYRIFARKQLETNTRIGTGKKDGLITIEVDDHDRQRAADIANGYVQELKRMTDTLAITEAQQRRAFFQRQVEQAQGDLSRAQQALQASGYNSGALRVEPRAAAESYARMKAEVTAAEVKVQSMRSYLADSAAELRVALESLAALRAELAKVESVDRGSAGGDYVAKYREFKYRENLFELFSKQLELARLDESREGALIQVVDPAQPPERKSKPKRLTIAVLAYAASMLLFLVWLIWRRSLQRARANRESAAKLEKIGEQVRKAVGLRH